ncbi:MAG: glycosyltransferase family 2 protein [Trueperaceae bacterium]
MTALDGVAAAGATLTAVGTLFVAYVLVGYPALLWLALRVRRIGLVPARRDALERAAPSSGDDDLPTVTVLIAAYDEADFIATKVRDTAALEYPADRLQLLVVADGSTDGTADIARSAAASMTPGGGQSRGVRIDVMHETVRRGKTAAIVRAMPFAAGDIVVLSDANNRLSQNALRRLVMPFRDPSVAIVGGAKTIERGDGDLGDSEGAYWRYEDAIKRMESELGSTVAVAGEILALRRALFRPPPTTVINDDFWLAADLLSRGYRVLYAPDARSVERVAPSLTDEMVRRSRIVAGRYQALLRTASGLSWREPGLSWMLLSHKFARPLLPFAIIGAFLGSAAWALGGSALGRAAFVLQAFGYTFALVGPRLALPRPIRRVASFGSYLIASNWAAVTGLAAYLRGRQTSVWQRVARRR